MCSHLLDIACCVHQFGYLAKREKQANCDCDCQSVSRSLSFVHSYLRDPLFPFPKAGETAQQAQGSSGSVSSQEQVEGSGRGRERRQQEQQPLVTDNAGS